MSKGKPNVLKKLVADASCWSMDCKLSERVNSSSSLLKPTLPLDLADVPSLDFPAFLPEPLVRLPMASSQQVPTFTPLICDPIVHIPVIDVCSSGGQGYLVSAGPSLSTTITERKSKLRKLKEESTDCLRSFAQRHYSLQQHH
ncbi:hypothetical protein V6N13_107419 [Hibiscus sabdariffa]|uniref:Uncharacterized protein n=1 Tax=Hibiscus sabdariffa TaxID=183260 RepID=A0ABR2SPC6_9ROSI